MTTIITWRVDRAPGRNLKDLNSVQASSAKRTSRYYCSYIVLQGDSLSSSSEIVLVYSDEWLCRYWGWHDFFSFCQNIVSCVTGEYNREQLWLANESFIIQLQARIRGYLIRRKHTERMEYLHQQEPFVVKIQVGDVNVGKTWMMHMLKFFCMR